MVDLIIDGASYSGLAISVSRSAQMRQSDISGYMMDKSYFADVLGTYLSYDVKVAVPVSREYLYTELFEKVTDPVGSHSFTLPYNQGIVNITGRVEGISDAYFRAEGSTKIWRSISFTIVSNYPTKTLSLGEVLEIGMQSPPDAANPEEGDIWMFTNGEWVHTDFTDGDEVYW